MVLKGLKVFKDQLARKVFLVHKVLKGFKVFKGFPEMMVLQVLLVLPGQAARQVQGYKVQQVPLVLVV
jgi:hypothetical protein